MKPEPAAPSTESWTWSLLVLIVRPSESCWSSLQILVNSPELMVMIEVYSVSGMLRCSTSRVMRLRANSVVLPVFWFSNLIFRVLGSWSAWRVIESYGSASFITLHKLAMLMPRTTGWSHLYSSKPSMLKFNDTRAT